jgi:hypothetical protein
VAAPFTIRIFVPDGDPEGVRLIDRMNWTELGIAFLRTRLSTLNRLAETRSHSESRLLSRTSRIRRVSSASGAAVAPYPHELGQVTRQQRAARK